MKIPHPYAELLRAIADGEEIECADTRSVPVSWSLISSQFALHRVAYDAAHLKLRVKPKTIRIGEYDVPEPMRVEPEEDAEFFLPAVLLSRKHILCSWAGHPEQYEHLAAGFCHSTAEAAELHAKALISLTSSTKE